MKIQTVHARQILDSRGNPTVEADVTLDDGSVGRAAVPSGASTGSHEAHELRDGDKKAFRGNGVLQAVAHVNEDIAHALMGANADQTTVDQAMLKLDGTQTKERLGANAILSVSLALAKAVAVANKQPLYRHLQALSGTKQLRMPVPLVNIVNGGAHAANATDIQEFMVVPVGARSFSRAIQMAAETFHALKDVLITAGYPTTVGDEGGYAPHVRNGNKEALELIEAAIAKAGYTVGDELTLALDVAASELYAQGTYNLKTEGKALTSPAMHAWLVDLAHTYPIESIEDGLAENDWGEWGRLTESLGDKLQLVGDDLFVTNVKFLQKGIDQKVANAILIKVNQIGTLTETIAAVTLAHQHGYRAIISHRSGETEDTTIAHLAVGLGTGQIKTGSMSRSERTAKYNELLRIAEELGKEAIYPGADAFA